MNSLRGLHVIVGGTEIDRTLELARIAEAEGATAIQLREKSKSTGEILVTADSLRNIIKRSAFHYQ